MNPSKHFNGRKVLSALLAAAIVGSAGLAFDKGHAVAAPAGVIEIGELTPVDGVSRLASLPEITVTAPRLIAAERVAERV